MGGIEAGLERLRREDALGQLLEGRGAMAELAEEAGDRKLAWATQMAWVLDHPEALGAVEETANQLRAGGVRHLIWAGMGGSVQVVRVLCRLGVFDGAGIAVHPLDSTDPAALNRILDEISKGRPLPEALAETFMVAVSMGMTSEEPITHLEWFEGLLEEHGVEGTRVMVMTLPGSYLDDFARKRGARRLPIQLDGESHTAGRMSAPSTQVFLLPAALALGGKGLREVVERCQSAYRIRPGLAREERDRLVSEDPFIRLSAWLHAQIGEGRNAILLDLAGADRGFGPWVEQVVEESLGKGGRGLLVFLDQDLRAAHGLPDRVSVVRVGEGSGATLPDRPHHDLPLGTGDGTAGRLEEAARFFAGWDLAVAMLGYLEGITFAGQPAVEGYKRYARELRDRDGDLPYPERGLVASPDGEIALWLEPLADAGIAAPADASDPAAALAALLRAMVAQGRLGYLDVTLNGEPAGELWDAVGEGARELAAALHRPLKVRSGPADYHSTEQSETDGPPELLSIRILVREPEAVRAGAYSARFLHAQALGTVAAMRDAHRPVVLLQIRGMAQAPQVRGLLAEAARQTL